MIVATFNATTGWAGKNITWQDDCLVLEGHGRITTADVMEYDRQGHLDWPAEEMRDWAAARLSWEQAVATPQATVAAGAANPAAPATPVTPTMEAHRPFFADSVAEAPVANGEPAARAAVADAAPAEAGPQAAPAPAEPAPLPADEVHDVLAPGGEIAELVGTAPYQESLEEIAGGKPESAPELEKWAHLVPEPDNPWDRNAVAVYIDARKIGYLPRESSAAYAALLTQLWADSRARAVCRAVVAGGSYKVTTPAGSVAEVDDEQFGVKLALAAPQHFDVTRELKRLTAEELAEGPPPV